MKKKKISGTSVFGAILFFLMVTAVVTVAILVLTVIPPETGRGLTAIIMLSVIVFLALFLTVLDVIRRRIMVERPVRKILEATDKIASGDFSVRLETRHSYRHYDEYDEIMDNINKMAAELSRTEVLHTDFISNVSHEIKTPLAVICSYAASLQSDGLDGETRKKYARTVESASERLASLVSNILKLNKLENQSLVPEYRKFRLDEMLSRTVIDHEEIIGAKNLNLDCDFEEVELYSCPEYLEIIWNNLLSNAIKFTNEGGNILITLCRVNGKAVVKFTDTGCGISKDVGEHIFEKFYQGDSSHSTEGNGLGLALVKKVIDVLGGEISVESEKGKGSTFTVTIKDGR